MGFAEGGAGSDKLVADLIAFRHYPNPPTDAHVPTLLLQGGGAVAEGSLE